MSFAFKSIDQQEGQANAYRQTVMRAAEYERLVENFRARRNTLLFGPDGVGKTQLLLRFVHERSGILFVPHANALRDILQILAAELVRLGDMRKIDTKITSSLSLKGLIVRQLENKRYCIVLDSIAEPTTTIVATVKDLYDFGRTPIIVAAQSCHGEDIGALRPLFCQKNEQIEMKNFDRETALSFAQESAASMSLDSENLDFTLHYICERSEGNPGAILTMLQMARGQIYRSGDQIRVHTLYLDFRMGRRP